MKKLILILALFPTLLFAESGTLTLDNKTINYDSTISNEVGTLYYAGETLVASEHETVTILYENDLPVLEAHDTDNDGTPDTFLTLDAEEEIVNITGSGADVFTRPAVVEFSTDMNQDNADSIEEDLVGSLDSITIPKYRNYTLYIIIILLLAGGYWWYRKRKRNSK